MNIDDTIKEESMFQKVNEFRNMIAFAQSSDKEYIETTPEVISFFNKNGLNGKDHFIYQGIKVFPEGRAKEILEYEARDMTAESFGNVGIDETKKNT